jgi:hypothetical protein
MTAGLASQLMSGLSLGGLKVAKPKSGRSLLEVLLLPATAVPSANTEMWLVLYRSSESFEPAKANTA